MTHNKEYWKEYYRNNKEKLLKYRKENPSKPNPQKLKEYYEKNSEKIKKHGRERYYEKKDEIKEYHRLKRNAIKEYLTNIKLNSHCCKCGEKHISTLDFHHLNPELKKFHIGDSSTKSLKQVEEEIKKCIIICSNCHRKLHYEENIGGVV